METPLRSEGVFHPEEKGTAMDKDRQARDNDVAEAYDFDPDDPEDRQILDDIEAEYQAAGGYYVMAISSDYLRKMNANDGKRGDDETPHRRLPSTDDRHDGKRTGNPERQSDDERDANE